MDIIDIVLAKKQATSFCDNIIAVIDEAQVQAFETSINEIIAAKSGELGMSISTVEDLVVKIKELQSEISTIKSQLET